MKHFAKSSGVHLCMADYLIIVQYRVLTGTAEQGGPGGPGPPIIFARLIEWRLIIISAAFSN